MKHEDVPATNGPSCREAMSPRNDHKDNVVIFGKNQTTNSSTDDLPAYKRQLHRIFRQSPPQNILETEEQLFTHDAEHGTQKTKFRISHPRLEDLKPHWPNVLDEKQEFLQKLMERDARNIERAALWHLVYELSVENKSFPLISLLLPDDHKKGAASAQALLSYAKRSGHEIRSLERLTAIALRLTRNTTSKNVREAIKNVTEMGHSMQVQCLTRTAYKAHERNALLNEFAAQH